MKFILEAKKSLTHLTTGIKQFVNLNNRDLYIHIPHICLNSIIKQIYISTHG